MNNKALVLIFLMVSSVSMLALFDFASAYPDGLIVINADGTIKGTTTIQQVGNIYTLTADINVGGSYTYAGIQVLRDNIVLDGAGYSLTTVESGFIGIDLSDRSNVTVENFRITGFKQGIMLGNSTGNIVSNNTINGYIGSSPCVGMGIWVDLSSQNNRLISNYVTSNSWGGIVVEAASSGTWIEGNTVANNEVGIGLSYCPYNTLKNNRMLGNNDSLQLAFNTREQFTQTIDSSNTIEGKPVYYWIGEHDKVVPSDAGYIALGDCSGITVQGLEINHGSITLCNTVNSTVTNNSLQGCATGINIQFCDKVRVEQNIITSSKVYGINVGISSNIDVIRNRLVSCGEGISTARSPVSQTITVSNNNLAKNSVGMHLVYALKDLICQNDFSENGLGINFVSCSYNNVTENNFQSSIGPSVRLSGVFNNTFYHNNFVYNSAEGGQAANPWITSTPGARLNIWDNGYEGNYWSDMQARYPNATQISGTVVWGTSYTINSENMDRYPLVERYISHQTSPSNPTTSAPSALSSTALPSNQEQINQQKNTPDNWMIIAPIAIAVASIAIAITYYTLTKLKKHQKA